MRASGCCFNLSREKPDADPAQIYQEKETVMSRSFEFLTEVESGREASGNIPSTTPIYRSPLSKFGFNVEYHGCKTLYELLRRSAKVFPNRPMHGKRIGIRNDGRAGPFRWQTYEEVGLIVNQLSRGLQQQGCLSGSKIGIYGPNAPEWAQAMHACSHFNAVCVPIYDTLGPNAVDYIIRHSETEFAFVASGNFNCLSEAILNIDKAECKLRGVCAWGDQAHMDEKQIKALQARDIRVWSWDEFVQHSESLSFEKYPPIKPTPEDICTIMYTSGTTGVPKGVVITHRAIMSAVASMLRFEETVECMKLEDEVHLSFLTLAHIYGRIIEEVVLAIGGRIGYWQGSIGLLADDIAELRPTFFCGVPRVWERMYDKVMSQIDAKGPIARFVHSWAVNCKQRYFDAGVKAEDATPFLDWYLFRGKIQSKLGGRLKFVVSGSAPLAPHLEQFIRVSLGTVGVQGYGLTETMGVSCVAIPDRHEMTGTVGPVQPCAEFRLESVVEMGYDAQGKVPRGEICFRGPCLFSGYYKNEEEYKKVVDEDGFFHTGDIAELHPSGALKIIDRKKNIFKLSQGEYVAVEKVETDLKSADVVEQIWVYGNSMRRSLVAVVVPKLEALSEVGFSASVKQPSEKPDTSGSLKQMCDNPEIKQYVLQQLSNAANTANLRGFERVRNVILESECFTIENGLLTPSYKLKRHVLLEQYKDRIDEMYARLEGRK